MKKIMFLMLTAIVTMTSCKEMKITADSQSPQVTTIRNEVKDFEIGRASCRERV